ncbi:MAG: ribonuclease Y [Erysipelotrichaceae bacterium]|nr:ribonuclease Y [Erysipelotrichaceae bacterium]
MNTILISILAFILGLIIGVLTMIGINTLKLKRDATLAVGIIEQAKKDAEKSKRESILEAKEEIHKLKIETEKDIKEKKKEIKESEDRLLKRESNMDRRDLTLQNREDAANERENALLEKQKEIQEKCEQMEELKKEQLEKLEKIAGFSKGQAHDVIMKQVEENMSKEIASYIKERESEAKIESNNIAKEMIINSMQRYAADITNTQTVCVISLPNDEMKGRIIGREGRNVRTIEAVTGVDLIIDDTPEAIVISSFDPLRREIARLTLETLISDGRIHPARIEEVYDKTCNDVQAAIQEYGRGAIYSLGISKMDAELIEIIGKLHFRTSYSQNALKHSIEVANIAGLLASELGENVNLAKRAGLLHDIGKAIDYEMEGSHVQIGAELARKYGEDEIVINAILSHHGDVEPTSIISSIVAIADTISASRPGARNDTSENYFQRLEQLEEIGTSIAGVEKAYAVQAGREIRVMVNPTEVDDLTSYQVARKIKEKIEEEMQYPGTIKVTVIRETRACEEAK